MRVVCLYELIWEMFIHVSKYVPILFLGRYLKFSWFLTGSGSDDELQCNPKSLVDNINFITF